MTREEKIDFIVEAIENVEGVKVYPYMFALFTDEQLDKDVEWYDYLLGK